MISPTERISSRIAVAVVPVSPELCVEEGVSLGLTVLSNTSQNADGFLACLSMDEKVSFRYCPPLDSTGALKMVVEHGVWCVGVSALVESWYPESQRAVLGSEDIA